MKLPHFIPRKKNVELAQTERTFSEASELAHLRLEECINDLQDRMRAPKQALDRQTRSAADEPVWTP